MQFWIKINWNNSSDTLKIQGPLLGISNDRFLRNGIKIWWVYGLGVNTYIAKNFISPSHMMKLCPTFFLQIRAFLPLSKFLYSIFFFNFWFTNIEFENFMHFINILNIFASILKTLEDNFWSCFATLETLPPIFELVEMVWT